MNSETLLEMGFCEWKPFQLGVERLAPEDRGVYAFKSMRNTSLKRGSSDIMYIGRARSNQEGPYHNIRHCLREYLHPGRNQKNKIRIGQKAVANSWHVSWLMTDTPEELERQLLRHFSEEHGQLPPENRQLP